MLFAVLPWGSAFLFGKDFGKIQGVGIANRVGDPLNGQVAGEEQLLGCWRLPRLRWLIAKKRRCTRLPHILRI